MNNSQSKFRRLKGIVLAGTAIPAAALFGAPASAQSGAPQCTNFSPVSGETVICGPEKTDGDPLGFKGVIAPDADDVTVHILPKIRPTVGGLQVLQSTDNKGAVVLRSGTVINEQLAAASFSSLSIIDDATIRFVGGPGTNSTVINESPGIITWRGNVRGTFDAVRITGGNALVVNRGYILGDIFISGPNLGNVEVVLDGAGELNGSIQMGNAPGETGTLRLTGVGDYLLSEEVLLTGYKQSEWFGRTLVKDGSGTWRVDRDGEVRDIVVEEGALEYLINGEHTGETRVKDGGRLAINAGIAFSGQTLTAVEGGGVLDIAGPGTLAAGSLHTSSLVIGSGGVLNNAGDVTFGSMDNAGTINNTGSLVGTANTIVNTGTINSTTKINDETVIDNRGTINASGELSAPSVVNTGTINVTGDLTGQGSSPYTGQINEFTNTGGGILNVNAGTFSGIVRLTNSVRGFDPAIPGTINVAEGAALSVAELINLPRDFPSENVINNNGTITTTTRFYNNSTVNNGATGVINGGLENEVDAGVFTSGTINGGLVNRGGTYAFGGTINGGITNSGNGEIAGDVSAPGILTNNGLLSVSDAGALRNLGDTTNTGGIVNRGVIEANGFILNQGGEIGGSGKINSATAITNSASARIVASGELSAPQVFNSGSFLVTSDLTGVGTGPHTGSIGSFTNSQGGVLTVQAGTFSGISRLENREGSIITPQGGRVEVAEGASLIVDTFANTDASSTVSNAGTITIISGPLDNIPGTITNTATGVINGGVLNRSTAVLNTAGVINDGLTNRGFVTATGGAINGRINNTLDGSLRIDGAVTGDGALDNSQSAALTVTGSLTGLTEFNNASVTPVLIDNGTLQAGTVFNSNFSRIVIDGVLDAPGGTANLGTIEVGIGGTRGELRSDINAHSGDLIFNRSDEYAHTYLIGPGTGRVRQIGSGATILSAANAYTGATLVEAGTLRINGDQSAATGDTTVFNGATLGGSGIIGGNVFVNDGGTLAPGNSPGTLTINGNLNLTPGSLLDFEFGQANVVNGPFNDLVEVGGDLVLDGTINVTVPAGGTFGPGVYRVFNYGGTLTDNGLELGALPAGAVTTVQTAIANQVNLINTAGLQLNFWDGQAGPKNNNAVDGGDGIWQNSTGNDNWTDSQGQVNGTWADSGFAVFQGAPGNVTVDNSLGQVRASGMQFAVDGYVVGGEPIELTGANAIVRVGDGSAGGAGTFATIASQLTGAARLVKTDAGRLVLTGENVYNGGTTIEGGTLDLGGGGFSGSVIGDIVNNGTLALSKGVFGGIAFSNTVSGTGRVIHATEGTTRLTGENTYTGGTIVNDGFLSVGNGGTTGSIVGDVENNSRFAFNRSDDVTFAGVISGAGIFGKNGLGTVTLTGDSPTTGGVIIERGALQLGNGGTSGSLANAQLFDVRGTLAVNRSDAIEIASLIEGVGSFEQRGTGTTTMSFNNRYTGTTSVNAGTLLINGDQSGSTGATNVANGATLGGTGTIGGDVTIADGATLSPGVSPGTLTINGNLNLSGGSILDYEFGQANVPGGPLNDLVNVGGNLVLDGTINVTEPTGGTFSPGLYRVFNYGGTLTNNVLTVGSLPRGTAIVQTSVAGQVNLINTAGLTFNYWDGQAGPKNNGQVNGGSGVWQNSTGNDNWTGADGAINAPFSDGSFAVFQAAPGTVTVDNSLGQVTASGMQFAVDGYRVTGGALTLGGAEAVIRVGDGTLAGRNMTARIDAPLTGARINKNDIGTLILTGNHSTNGALVSSGLLQLGEGATAGTIVGGVDNSGRFSLVSGSRVEGGLINSGSAAIENSTLNGGLQNRGNGIVTTDGATSINGNVVNTDNGGIATRGSTTFNGTFDNSGRGNLIVSGNTTGITTLANTAGSGGGVTISSGTLTANTVTNAAGSRILVDGTLNASNGVANDGLLIIGANFTRGEVNGQIANNGTVQFNRSDDTTYAGSITGTGQVEQIANSTLTFTANQRYTGATIVRSGTLQLGNGGTSGAIAGDANVVGTLAFNRSDDTSYGGVISGTGAVRKLAANRLTLTGNSAGFAGTTAVEQGALVVNGALGGTMTLASGTTLEGTGSVGSLNHAAGSTVRPGDRSIGTLTVAGNYNGGGTLALETVLGGDGSLTDLLRVGGSTAGATAVTVANQGGSGAPTTEGIKVVDVGGASNGVFTLANGNATIGGQGAIVVGAYAYQLQKNGIANPADGDWYLRSSGAGFGLTSAPLFQPNVPIAEAYPQTLLAANTLPTLQQRVGNRQWLAGAGAEDRPTGYVDGSGMWMRIEGNRHRSEPRFSTSFVQTKGSSWSLDFGVSGRVAETGDNALVGGLVGSYSEGSTDIASVFGNGEIDTKRFSIGGTLTWYGANGFYADAQGRISFFDSDLTSTSQGRVASGNDGKGYAASLEVGKRFAVDTKLSVTPQLQLAYNDVEFRDMTDSFGSRIALEKGRSLKGRAGVSLDHQNSWQAGGKTNRSHLYGIANLSYEFLDGTQVDFAGTDLRNSNQRLWAGLGLGGSVNLKDDRLSFYGEASANSPVNNFGNSYDLKATVGLRLRFGGR